jgi:hypothetical protein
VTDGPTTMRREIGVQVITEGSSSSSSLFNPLVFQVHNLFQNKLSTERDLQFSLSISCILTFPYSDPVTAYVFILVVLFLLSSLQ